VEGQRPRPSAVTQGVEQKLADEGVLFDPEGKAYKEQLWRIETTRRRSARARRTIPPRLRTVESVISRGAGGVARRLR
jgi:hypothetical protein